MTSKAVMLLLTWVCPAHGNLDQDQAVHGVKRKAVGHMIMTNQSAWQMQMRAANGMLNGIIVMKQGAGILAHKRSAIMTQLWDWTAHGILIYIVPAVDGARKTAAGKETGQMRLIVKTKMAAHGVLLIVMN